MRRFQRYCKYHMFTCRVLMRDCIHVVFNNLIKIYRAGVVDTELYKQSRPSWYYKVKRDKCPVLSIFRKLWWNLEIRNQTLLDPENGLEALKYIYSKLNQFTKPNNIENLFSYFFFQVCLVLDKLFDVPCRILHCPAGLNGLPTIFPKLEEHFAKSLDAPPIMMGGDRDASSKGVLGTCSADGDNWLLILVRECQFSRNNITGLILLMNRTLITKEVSRQLPNYRAKDTSNG